MTEVYLNFLVRVAVYFQFNLQVFKLASLRIALQIVFLRIETFEFTIVCKLYICVNKEFLKFIQVSIIF